MGDLVLNTLDDCELVIERGLKSFVEVGQALAQIRDKRLYKAEFDTFEAYCRERWDLSRGHSYNLMDGSERVRQMSAIAGTPLPTSLGQARELSGLEVGEAQEVMELAESATGGNITAKAIKEARIEYEGGPKPKPEKRDYQTEIAELQAQINDLQETCSILNRENQEMHAQAMQSQGGDWAQQLLTLSGDNANTVFRALAKVLHPDAGGNAQLMDQLKQAKEKVINHV